MPPAAQGGPMAWEKAPQWLVELFGASLPDGPGLERRKMFGYPAAFANGHMFAGVFEDVVFARLPPRERSGLEAAHGVRHFEPMPGRPMTAYCVLPDEALEDERELQRLLAAAYSAAAAMPPKQKKPRRSRAAKASR
jgi:TfoX/Sxy family transcriptional regulator of competence genes